MKMNELTNRLKGTIYGQAIGDALGLGTEGMTDEDMAWKYPNGIRHYSEIFQDRHRKRWKIGDWTDDTDMMLCIANAVIKDKGVNLTTIAQNFKEWADGEPMGIGENTYKVLMIGDYVEKPLEVSKKVWEMSNRQAAANGGLMRTSIVGLFPKAVEECAANICRLTHYDPRCVGSCVIVSELIHSLVYDNKGLTYNRSHISYYSHVAWMISRYKQIGGDDKYDDTYHSLCKAMNNRICQSPIFNAPTYPGECIYIPDMLVAIVALSNYAHQYSGKYQSTVDKWIEKASSEWIDQETGLLASFLEEDHGKAQIALPVKGSYSALNCYYLSLVAPKFAQEQYELLKKNFRQDFLITGLKEYHDRTCLFGMDIDAGPIIFNLSPSGTGFVIGAATSLEDMEFRKQLLKTAEIGGSTVSWFGSSHYLLANIALVGEAIILAMRTSAPQTRMCNK